MGRQIGEDLGNISKENTNTDKIEQEINEETTQDNKSIQSTKEKKKKQRIVRNSILIALAIVIIIILLLLKSCGIGGEAESTPSNTSSGFSTEVDSNATDGKEEKTKEEIEAELNEKVAAGMINISMNTSPVFETSTSEGNLLIVNNESNNYPQVIEIYTKDTEELIYQSKMIPVGKTVEKAKLDKKLEKGIYPCIAYFNAVNPETGESLGKAGAEIKVEILN